MRFSVLLLGFTLSLGFACGSGEGRGKRQVLLLPNLAIVTSNGQGQIHRYIPDGSRSKPLFSAKEDALIQPLPDGKGYLVVESTHATLVSGIEEFPPMTLPFEEHKIVGAVLPAPNIILTIDDKGTIDMWQAEKKVEGRSVALQQPQDSLPIAKGSFSQDGMYVLTHYQGDSNPSVWETKTGKLRYTLSEFSDEISSFTFSRDGKSWLIGSLGGQVLWGQNLGIYVRIGEPLREQNQGAHSVAISPSGNSIATGDGEGNVRIYTLYPNARYAEGKLQQNIKAHEGKVTSVSFSDDGNSLVSTGDDKMVRVYSLQFGTSTDLDLRATLPAERILKKGSLSKEGTWLVTTAMDQTIRIFSERAVVPNPASEFGQEVANEGLGAVAFFNNDRYVISGHGSGKLRIWEAFPLGGQTPVKKPTLQNTLIGHVGKVNSLTTSPDGNIILTASDDQTAKLWQTVPPYGQLSTLSGHTSAVTSAIFSADGAWVVTTSSDRTAKLWNVLDPKNPQLLASISGHRSQVNAAAFSPNKQTLVTGGEDGLVNVWDLSDLTKPTLRVSFRAHMKEKTVFAVRSVAISKDGTFLLTGGAEGQTKIFDLETQRYLANPTGNSYSADAILLPSVGGRYAVIQGDILFFRQFPFYAKTAEFSIE